MLRIRVGLLDAVLFVRTLMWVLISTLVRYLLRSHGMVRALSIWIRIWIWVWIGTLLGSHGVVRPLSTWDLIRIWIGLLWCHAKIRTLCARIWVGTLLLNHGVISNLTIRIRVWIGTLVRITLPAIIMGHTWCSIELTRWTMDINLRF
uniref:Uncharacterized protein n=1 Tax=Opuntia streptacantha TaxID=393608 RepID=A0A7C9D7W9_OPUST